MRNEIEKTAKAVFSAIAHSVLLSHSSLSVAVFGKTSHLRFVFSFAEVPTGHTLTFDANSSLLHAYAVSMLSACCNPSFCTPISRSLYFCILPLAVMGNSVSSSTYLGFLKRLIPLAT